MSIATHNPVSNRIQQPPVPKIEPDSYKSVVIDNGVVPLTSLLGYVDGSVWSVDEYYRQVITEHNDLKTIDSELDPVFQQHELITNLEIRVSQALQNNYDQELGTSTVTGNGHIYNVIVPNVNDYFVTGVSITNKGLFRITSVERKTYNDGSVFYIDYTLVGYLGSNVSIANSYSALKDSVVRSYYYSKERMVSGLSPLLRTEQQEMVVDWQNKIISMARMYMTLFYHRGHGTLILPGQNFTFYDNYILRFIQKIFPHSVGMEMRKMNEVTLDGDVYNRQITIWDLLLLKNGISMESVRSKIGFVDKSLYLQNTYSKTIAFSSIDYCTYPIETDQSIYNNIIDPQKPINKVQPLVQTINKDGVKFDYDKERYKNAVIDVPINKDILTGVTYILSQDFYNNTASLSILEVLVRDYINNKPLDSSTLNTLVNSSTNWNRLEQFYHIPIIILLLKVGIQGVYL